MPPKNPNKMNKKELLAYANESGIEVPKGATKAQILALIPLSDKSVGFPNVAPPSLSERNAPPKPKTLRVCGNVVRVKDGVAEEADSKVLRRRAKDRARRRGEKPEETRI